MSTEAETDPLLAMVAHSLRASGAPRFLIHLFLLPPGEHRLHLDHPELAAEDREGWLIVTETPQGRSAALSYPTVFRREEEAGLVLPTVWTHLLVAAGELRETKTHEETLPESWDYRVEVGALASGASVVEDMCDACALPMDPTLCGAEPPETLESLPPFSGRL